MCDAATVAPYAEAFGIDSFFDHQLDAFKRFAEQERKAACLYFPTGQGKTKTSLTMMALEGRKEVLVIAPPSTQKDWIAQGALIGITVTAISHAKFRQKDFKVKNADTAIIVDEFHLLGGRKSDGWTKFDRRIAPHLKAPFIICSATPSYNDLERVYCVHHVLDPESAKGGYAQYQLEHCLLEVAYRGLPKVVGFKEFLNAAEFLESLPGVYYMEDTAEYSIMHRHHAVTMPTAWLEYNFDERTGLVMHSIMTRRVSWANHHLITNHGRLNIWLLSWLTGIIKAHTPGNGEKSPVLIYCDKTKVAEAAAQTLKMHLQGFWSVEILTGGNTKKQKDAIIEAFKQGEIDVLVATSTLATGTDGLDKVCDTMVILQDTPDDSLRRQLVGRILPRGVNTGKKKPSFYRVVLPPVPK